MDNEIPSWLIQDIEQGRAILFLGAGASYGAASTSGGKVLSGEDLRNNLCDHFLEGKLKNKSLSQVSELAKNGVGLKRVQEHIRGLFNHLVPAEFHRKIPSFRWRAIFTTNYDRIVERAYSDSKEPMQSPLVLVKNTEELEKKLSSGGVVPIIKLHGCIDHYQDEEIPFILASEEYAKHRRNRDQLFSILGDWGRTSPIIFCGYKIDDPNVQQIIFDIGDNAINRPSYMVVDPGMISVEVNYWKSRRFVVFSGTFEEFINHIDDNTDKNNRVLSQVVSFGAFSSYEDKIKSLDKPVQMYLEENLTYVHKHMSTSKVSPELFYRGLSDDWGAFQDGLDSDREISDLLLVDIALKDRQEVSQEFYILKGYAGSGKSVIQRRFAWSASHDYGRNVLFVPADGYVNPLMLLQLFEVMDFPLLVIDDVSRSMPELNELFSLAKIKGVSFQVVAGVRFNQWNDIGANCNVKVNAEYEVDNLSPKEVSSLVEKLIENNQLPASKSNPAELQGMFVNFASNVLLVGLYEALDNGVLSDVVYDEYEKISTEEARIIYRDICTLNRFGVPVRAGLVARISNIDFTCFKLRLLKPLERVVKVEYSGKHRDYIYLTRHPMVAEQVFDRVFPDEEARSAQVVRVLRSMNPAFQSDGEAIDVLIKGRELSGFRNKHFVKNIYDAALSNDLIDKSYVYHQMAVFELRHSGTDLEAAMSYVRRAEGFSRGDHPSPSLLHTKANILRRKAVEAVHALEKEKFRSEAKKILRPLAEARFGSPSISLLAKIYIDEIEEYVNSRDASDAVVQEMIRQVESLLESGAQRYPNDEHIDEVEADLNRVLGKDDKVAKLLESAVVKSQYEPSVSMRYIKCVRIMEGETSDKIGATLRSALGKYPTNKHLNFELGMYCRLFKDDESQRQSEVYFKRSYSIGDERYVARFWHARQLYILGKRDDAKVIFEELSVAKVPPSIKDKVWAEISEGDSPVEYKGHVLSTHGTFMFVRIDDLGDSVFCHHNALGSTEVSALQKGTNVRCFIGFSYKGPAVLALSVA